MIVDARILGPAAFRTADVCVIGSGLTVAHELAAAGLDVAVVESGGTTAEPELDRLQEAAEGMRFGTVEQISGTRRVGGNANLWSVRLGGRRCGLRLVPLSCTDLEPRDWMPGSGWPITAADLAPAYHRAQREFGLPDLGYDVGPWETPTAGRLPLDDRVLRTEVFQFADSAELADRRVADLAASPICTIYHHAYVVELRTDPGATRVTDVRALTSLGREVVLACGGLATTQLLLASGDVRRGLERVGGRRGADHLGRHFMDHPLVDGGVLEPADTTLVDRMALYDLRTVHGVPVMGHLRLADDVLRSEPVPQLSTMFFPRHASQREPDPTDTRSAAARESVVAVRDAVRARRLRIEWAWTPQDARGTARAHAQVADAVRRAGLGVLRPVGAGVSPVVLGSSTNHYLGTTRMSADPAAGVVDAECRVHGLDNLYVASTSVFPTGGFANPTLTLVALALRVAQSVLSSLG